MQGSTLLILFVQIGVILALSRVVGLLFARIGQPQVMGEMIAGIMLGPSLLGWVGPGTYAALFPPESVRYLGMLSQIGVVFFLFLIGLELDPALLRKRGHAAVVISHMSIIAPFLLGAGLALYLYPRLFNDSPSMSFRAVALFMGASMSITAFPVLARILTERNLHKTQIGAVAITCAAVDDVTAWCMLAFVVAAAQYRGIGSAATTAGLAVAYVLAMFFIVRPFLRKLETVYERQGRLSQQVVAIVLLLVLTSAATTEKIGIHALFGAFLMGCMMPKGTRFVRHLSEKLEDFTVVLLLPIFFAFSGLRTRIGLLDNTELWIDTAVIIGIACLGKFGGSAAAARLCGIGWREASAIGILMNTRGLMELVILNIGRELGVITDAVFAMMVIMAIVTTAMTTPILNLVYPVRLLMAEPALAGARLFRILAPISLPASGVSLARLAAMLLGKGANGRFYALHLRRPVEYEAYRSGLPEGGEDPVLEPIAPLLEEAKALSLPVEPISFISRDVAADITATAVTRHVDLVLMGFHKPVFSAGFLGGTVHRVLAHCPAHVAIFMDRGTRPTRRILVPYLGSPHDRLALELAARISRNTAAQIAVLHVVPAVRGHRSLDAKNTVQRIFNDPATSAQVDFRVVEHESPAAVVIEQAREFDLVIIGVAEEWGLESHLFGWRPERIARECPSSMLIVRRYEHAQSAADSEGAAAVAATPPVTRA